MNFDGEEILVHMSMSDDEEAGHGEQSMNCRVQCCCMVSYIRARSEEISTAPMN